VTDGWAPAVGSTAWGCAFGIVPAVVALALVVAEVEAAVPVSLELPQAASASAAVSATAAAATADPAARLRLPPTSQIVTDAGRRRLHRIDRPLDMVPGVALSPFSTRR